MIYGEENTKLFLEGEGEAAPTEEGTEETPTVE